MHTQMFVLPSDYKKKMKEILLWLRQDEKSWTKQASSIHWEGINVALLPKQTVSYLMSKAIIVFINSNPVFEQEDVYEGALDDEP